MIRQEDSDMNVLDWLLSHHRKIDAKEISSLGEWKDIFFRNVSGWNEPIDRAVIGGFFSDRAGYAFAAGYEAALMKLAPTLPERSIVSLCVTEEQGGHPGMIKSTLQKAGADGPWTLNGSKKFITLADEADMFLVAASTGTSPNNKNVIRIARVERNAPGIEVARMPDLAFVPEIGHGIVRMHEVTVEDSRLLPGDGYTKYIKPFRTIEDLHVSAAIEGYIFRVAGLYQWPHRIMEQIAGLLAGTRALAREDPSSPGVHVALGGLRAHMLSVFESTGKYWKMTDAATRSNWERDGALLGVAEKSRIRRLEKAWEQF
jgi:acyl-CoA dehydrogenase